MSTIGVEVGVGQKDRDKDSVFTFGVGCVQHAVLPTRSSFVVMTHPILDTPEMEGQRPNLDPTRTPP